MRISLIKLFLIYLKVGAFTFGGGYAMIPIFERELVVKYKLIKPDSFYDTLVICQSLPGVLAVNFAVYTGLKLRGVKGAFVNVLGVTLPSFVFILVIAMVFFQYIDHPLVSAFFVGVRVSVVALIFLAGLKLLKKNRTLFGAFMMVITFALIAAFNTHPFIVIFGAGLFGYVVYTLRAVIDYDPA